MPGRCCVVEVPALYESGIIGHFIDQVRTAGLVDTHLTVNQTGERDNNGSAAGSLHNHVNEVLRAHRTRCFPYSNDILTLIPTAALAGSVPQCRQPVQRVSLLSLRPLADDVDQVTQVLPGTLLAKVKRGEPDCVCEPTLFVRCAPPSKRLPSRIGKASASIELPVRHLRKRGVFCEQADVHGVHRSKSCPPPSACRGRKYLRRSRRESLQRSHVRKEFVRVLSERGCIARPVRWGARNLQRRPETRRTRLSLSHGAVPTSWRILPISS